MREVSLHIMDIVENSIGANSKNIYVEVYEDKRDNLLKVMIKDDGIGIDEETLLKVKDPFLTSRKERKVGLGLSLFEATCLMCNGTLEVKSKKGKGTEVVAIMEYKNIDRIPIGRIEETIVAILMNQNLDLMYIHKVEYKEFLLDSRQIKDILNSHIFEVSILNWIKEYIKENLNNIGAERI